MQSFINNNIKSFTIVPPYLWEICSQTPPWMPETVDGTKPYKQYIHTYDSFY